MMRYTLPIHVATAAFALSATLAPGQGAPSFTVYAPQPGVGAEFFSASDGGDYAFGYSGSSTMEWTRSGGFTFGGVFPVGASEVSGDGRFAASSGFIGTASRRARDGSIINFGPLHDCHAGLSTNINTDGSVVVGSYCTSRSNHPTPLARRSDGVRRVAFKGLVGRVRVALISAGRPR